MQSIVVGTDGSPEALNAVEEAGRLAGHEDGVVHVVCAYSAQANAMAPELATAIEHVRSRADGAIKRAAERLEALGVRHECYAVEGRPADALLDVARAQDASLVVVGSRGMRGGRRVLGSVPNTVTHKAPCNVLVVRTD